MGPGVERAEHRPGVAAACEVARREAGVKPRTIIFRRVSSAPAQVERRVGAVPMKSLPDAALAWSGKPPSRPDAARGLLTTLRPGTPRRATWGPR